MIRAADLHEWVAADETDKRGGWTVRERMIGLNSEQPPVLLIATGSQENMKMIAAAPKLAAFLAEIIRSENPNPVRVVMKARALLLIAGVEP